MRGETKQVAFCNKEDIHYLGQSMNYIRQSGGFGVLYASSCVKRDVRCN